jgi:hypothetical protein
MKCFSGAEMGSLSYCMIEVSGDISQLASG